MSDPELIPAAAGIPETLRARFYFWQPAPPGVQPQPGYNALQVRRLDAIDVVIHKANADSVSILATSRNRTILHRRDGVLAALEGIFQTADASIKVDRRSSVFELFDTDIFLWLAVKVRDNKQIAPSLELDQVAGVSGRDSANRVADLRSGVDFTRPNFLTAVAESDTLGPIDISFVHDAGGSRRSYALKLWIDGGFTISANEIHIPAILDTRDLMITATLELAFVLIPQINSLYENDGSWPARRLEVIEEAMEELVARYQSARAALQARKP
ncbi:hypothetical protein QP157_08665 [Sphingomonas sp. LR61]|uniref:hypothetical protein n=1 Tax=Sphingomonas sp. LR61 TaxID=3050234 RepID=UPI002FE168C9